jgi:small subunit ribosomal protein S1
MAEKENAENEKAAEETPKTAASAKKTESKKSEESVENKETAKAEKPAKKEVKKEAAPVTNGEPLKDFDWSRIGKYEETYSDTEKADLEKMYDATLASISTQDVVMGTVVGINEKEVVVNINYKSEGIIPISEVKYNPDLKVGDEIEVFIENQEDRNGQLNLSHAKARSLKAWDRVNSALETEEIVKGYVKCRTKGGLIVDVFGIEAFLPGSQIDVKPIRDYDVYVAKTMEFRVVKINKEFKNVVVSHKALIEAEIEQQKREIISKLEKGQVLEGVVKNITSYGVFIDLGGVDGLIHITDLSWGRISHPEEIVKLDEKINVVILDFDESKSRIALGLKQLSAHPWENLGDDVQVGDVVKGKVVVVADYGAFIEIKPGIEGLVHVSEITWSNHLKPAQEFFKVGDEVEAKILSIDREERKMSLGIKQLKPDPWEGIESKYAVDSKHTGKVTNISDFGVFVELEEGIDGLVHISDLSWSKKINHPSEITKVGENLEVVILEIDRENRRLKLGYKQLEENPWDTFESVFTPESVHEGTIIGIKGKTVVVSLPYGVEGIATKNNIVKEDGKTANVDEKLNFKVLEFNKNSKRILVSHTQTFQDEVEGDDGTKGKTKAKKGKATNKAIQDVRSNLEKTTLGDLDALSSLKADLEKDEE